MNYIFKSEESACFKYKYEFYFFLERINIMKFDFLFIHHNKNSDAEL